MLNRVFDKPLAEDYLIEQRGDDVIKVRNTASNTHMKYAEAALWAEEHGACIVEYPETAEHPHGFYRVEPLPAPTYEELLESAKADRAAAVAAITVEVDGLVFDGDEAAQERMARAVTLADSPDEQTEWVLHDNTVAVVTADQLRRACKAAGKAQTALWTVPYQS